MYSSKEDIATFQKLAQQNSSLRWYVIADSAQNPALPEAVASSSSRVKCLFGATRGSPLAQQSPHVVEMCSPLEKSATWSWVGFHAKSRPCLTVISSIMSFNEIFERLAIVKEILLPDQSEMYLGFWDPIILAALVGNSRDTTLYVKGPILDFDQRSEFTADLAAWWYWDRAGCLQELEIEKTKRKDELSSFLLTQHQVDSLVEASVPDHIFNYIELNQPQILERFPENNRYPMICRALIDARRLNLTKMRDLVNFVCISCLYGEKINNDLEISNLLIKVREEKISFQQAVHEFPD